MSTRDEIFDRLQLVTAGEPVREAWPAAADLIATLVITGAQDRAGAYRLIDQLREGVASTVEQNWDEVRAQLLAHPAGGRA